MKIDYTGRISYAYRFTVQLKEGKPIGKGAKAVEELRRIVKLNNNEWAKDQYVKLAGRGPRPSKKYQATLPLTMSTHADVYVYER